MIVSFYNKDFEGLQNNASLVVDKNSFRLTKRPIELNDFSCLCEAFTEDIQPTFMVVKDDLGKHIIYSSLAGIPVLNTENKTEITGTDLKTLLSSDVILDYNGTFATAPDVVEYIFTQWLQQVNQGSINCILKFSPAVSNVYLDNFQPVATKEVYNALEEIQNFLNAYDLYLDTSIDLINKKVVFFLGKTMLQQENYRNIKLWEYGIKNYGKWIADVNEVQGYYVDDNGNWRSLINDETQEELVWILTSQNQITNNKGNRDIFPIKRRIFTSNESGELANKDALTELLNSRYNENLELYPIDFSATFETAFNIYVNKGGGLYKTLPCGELRYTAESYSYDEYRNLIVKPNSIQIGYRYVGVDFI